MPWPPRRAMGHLDMPRPAERLIRTAAQHPATPSVAPLDAPMLPCRGPPAWQCELPPSGGQAAWTRDEPIWLPDRGECWAPRRACAVGSGWGIWRVLMLGVGASTYTVPQLGCASSAVCTHSALCRAQGSGFVNIRMHTVVQHSRPSRPIERGNDMSTCTATCQPVLRVAAHLDAIRGIAFPCLGRDGGRCRRAMVGGDGG